MLTIEDIIIILNMNKYFQTNNINFNGYLCKDTKLDNMNTHILERNNIVSIVLIELLIDFSFAGIVFAPSFLFIKIELT